MQHRSNKTLAVLIFFGLMLSNSGYARDTLNETDPNAKCDFVGYLAYEIALYRDAGIDQLRTRTNLEHKYMDNNKISELVPFYVTRLYSDLTLNANNVQNIIKHRCLQQLSALYSQHQF